LALLQKYIRINTCEIREKRVKNGTGFHCELNAISPYFTMFPLEFPLSILKKHSKRSQVVFDPFCGRGTTNFASRLVGLDSYGIDSSPVAVAVAEAKLVSASANRIVSVAQEILSENRSAQMPKGAFWRMAYHPAVLDKLCRLRKGLLKNCESDTKKALRGIILGALHGPTPKHVDSHFSNQAPRTYAPKPGYAVKFWSKHKMKPRNVDVLQIIGARAVRYYSNLPDKVSSRILLGDSRQKSALTKCLGSKKIDWIITSPPYYGMRTYIPDQWLRLWFLGGADEVQYLGNTQLQHSCPEVFTQELNKVWTGVAEHCKKNAGLVVRFGGINDRKADPLMIIKESFVNTNWKIATIRSAGFSNEGRRQALHFKKEASDPREEFDLWATRR
jgi:DNA modification methylase